MTNRQKNGQAEPRRHGVVLGVEPRRDDERGPARDPRKVFKKNTTERAKRARQNGRY